MHFHLPRRHRRRLLLPPGLLALAGLLLLGCLYVRQDLRLKRMAAVQLVVPALLPPSDDVHSLSIYESPRELETLRLWREYWLTGNPLSDTISIYRISHYLSTLHTCTSSDTIYGAKVIFGKHSKYADFVKIINELTQRNIKKYVFETRISRPTLYILKNKPRPYLRPD